MKEIYVCTELKICYKGEEYSNYARAGMEVGEVTDEQIKSIKKLLIKMIENHSKQLLEHDELIVKEVSLEEYEANTEDNL